MWYGGGQPWSHSRLVLVSSRARTSRFAANASQMINIIMITATREISEPIDDKVFQMVYASG